MFIFQELALLHFNVYYFRIWLYYVSLLIFQDLAILHFIVYLSGASYTPFYYLSFRSWLCSMARGELQQFPARMELNLLPWTRKILFRWTSSTVMRRESMSGIQSPECTITRIYNHQNVQSPGKQSPGKQSPEYCTFDFQGNNHQVNNRQNIVH